MKAIKIIKGCFKNASTAIGFCLLAGAYQASMANEFVEPIATSDKGLSADQKQQASAISALTAKLQSFESMSSFFKQETRTSGGAVMQVIGGQMEVLKPNRLRWQTTPPYEQLVVADGTDLWVYDQDLEQVSVRRMDNSLQETPALLLSGNLNTIGDEYSVAVVDDEIFYLKPKDESQLFDRLTLIFADEKIQSLTIFDATGQYTLIEFSDVVNNKIAANDRFSFQIPDGVDVIDGR